MVELVEEPDVRLTTNVVDVAIDEIRVGLEVEVFFEQWAAGADEGPVWVPLFRPVEACVS